MNDTTPKPSLSTWWNRQDKICGTVEVDNFGFYAVLFAQFLGSVHSPVQGGANGKDGDFVELCGYTVLVELLAHVINALAFEEYNGIGAVESGFNKQEKRCLCELDNKSRAEN